MSTRELDRLQVLGRVAEKRLTQREAAVILGVTDRQLRRIWKRYQAEGAAGLVSKRRGQASNRRLPSELRELAIALVRFSAHEN